MPEAKYSPWLLALNDGEVPMPENELTTEEISVLGGAGYQPAPVMSAGRGVSPEMQRKIMDYSQLAAQEHEMDMARQEQHQQSLQDDYNKLEGQKQQLNYAPIAAFVDSQFGSKLSSAIPALSYQSPEEKQKMLLGLKEKIAALEQNKSKASQAYLKNQLAALKLGYQDPAQAEMMRLRMGLVRAQTDQAMGKASKPVLTPGQEAADRAFGTEYQDWNAQGGYSGAEKQINNLEEAKRRLNENKELTGGWKSFAPEFIQGIINKPGLETKQMVEQSVLQTLKQTMGSQFTENEGKRVFNTSWDDRLPTEANIRKLDATILDLKNRARAKDESSKYFEEHGTLKGYQGGVSSAPEAPVDAKTKRLQELRAKAGR